jgi:hypothetical protein
MTTNVLLQTSLSSGPTQSVVIQDITYTALRGVGPITIQYVVGGSNNIVVNNNMITATLVSGGYIAGSLYGTLSADAAVTNLVSVTLSGSGSHLQMAPAGPYTLAYYLENVLDEKVEAIRSLLTLYAGGLGKICKGILPPGDENIVVPSVYLQAAKIDAKMYTTGKYHRFWPVAFVFFNGDDNPEKAVEKCTDAGIIFVKLFSNNALGDLQTANPASLNFKQYNPYWINSEMTTISISGLIKWLGNAETGPKYYSIGTFMLTLETAEIV